MLVYQPKSATVLMRLKRLKLSLTIYILGVCVKINLFYNI